MRTVSKEELKELYDKDFPLWVEINLELLKEKAYDLVDWENLLEEIEDMGLRHLESCISYLDNDIELSKKELPITSPYTMKKLWRET